MKKFFFILFMLFNIDLINALDSFKDEREKVVKFHSISFDYNGHKKEREIAYSLFCKKYDCDDEFFPVSLADLGIALYDVNQDGLKEILIYINNPGFCGSAGCSFGIVLYKKNIGRYEFIKWRGTNYTIVTYPSIKILESKNFSYKDILFETKNTNPDYPHSRTWKWNGEFYE